MKCLLIEDDLADAEIMVTLIRKANLAAEVTVCHDSINGLKQLYHNNFDIIFLDLNLPDNWGISSITETKKYARKTPIIVTTSFASITTIEEAKKAGATMVFEKRNLTTSAIAGLIGERKIVGY